jgi:hypothetical protein
VVAPSRNRFHNKEAPIMRKFTTIALASLVFAGTGHLAAAAEPIPRDGITFVSGGIGLDAKERLQAQSGDYNLRLIFTLAEGNYLADVDVALSDARGNRILQHTADGPFFMAKLPAGQYTVTATYAGKTQTRRVNVGSRGLHTTYLRWPSNPQTDFVFADGR